MDENNLEENNLEENNLEENNSQNSVSKELLSLITELIDLQTTNARLQAAIFIRESRAHVKERVEAMRQSILAQAAIYGQKIEKVIEAYDLYEGKKNSIIEKYESILNEVCEPYIKAEKNFLERKANWENKEDVAIGNEEHEMDQRENIKASDEYEEFIAQEKKLNAELDAAQARRDYNSVVKIARELKNLKNPLTSHDIKIEKFDATRKRCRKKIQEYDEKIEKNKDEMNSKIDEITRSKNEELALVEMEKPNAFQRMVFRIINTINGARRFKANVIDAVYSTITRIREEDLPKIRATVKGKMNEIREEMHDMYEEAKEDWSEFKEAAMDGATIVRGAVKNKVDSGRETFNGIIAKGRDAKIRTLQSIRDNIQNSIDKSLERNEQLRGTNNAGPQPVTDGGER